METGWPAPSPYKSGKKEDSQAIEERHGDYPGIVADYKADGLIGSA